MMRPAIDIWILSAVICAGRGHLPDHGNLSYYGYDDDVDCEADKGSEPLGAKADFLETLMHSYLADGFSVDFSQTTDSANTINKYVEDKTNRKIDKLVEGLDASTVMYLISYIYFKGKWATAINPHLTREDLFMVDKNTKMMELTWYFDTYYEWRIQTRVLCLPFNSSYSMLLMLPDKMSTLEKAISPDRVTKWVSSLYCSTNFRVYIPKFSIKTSYKLNDVLMEMGMTDMFGERANLSGISYGNKLSVSEVATKQPWMSMRPEPSLEIYLQLKR